MTTREHIIDISVAAGFLSNEHALDSIASYFDRSDSKSQVEEELIKSYGMGIKEVAADESGSGSIETYTNKFFEEAVYRGEIDAISVGWAQKVAQAKATLFNEPGSKMFLEHETLDDLDAAEELLQGHRSKGGFNPCINLADTSSVLMGSAGVLVSYSGGSLQYKKLNPGIVRSYFGEAIEEPGDDGEAKFRPVDKSSVEDASLLMIRMGELDTGKYVWLAIFPRTRKHENGRYVSFIAGDDVTQIPDPGEENTFDYKINGEIANPLTWLKYNELDMEWVPEFPVSIINGCVTDSNELFPVTSAIYNLSISFDKDTTHLVDVGQQISVGTTVIKRDVTSQAQPLPRSLHGAVSLSIGQDIDKLPDDPAALKEAHEILKDAKVEAAASFAVPDFMVSSEDYTVDAASGVALAIKAKPLRKDREYRSSVNQAFVSRLFDIEKAYIRFKAEDDSSAVDLLMGCTQTWEPGNLHLPENPNDAAQRVSTMMDKGVLDTIAAIREYYQLPSDEDAKEVYNRMKARQSEFPPLKKEEKKPIGILRGNVR